jgi:hypothetical protein
MDSSGLSMKALAWVAGVNLCGRTAWRRTRPLAYRAGCRRTRRQPCAACRPDTGGYRLSAVRDAEPSSAPQLCAPSARSAVARRQRSACTYARGVGLRRTWLSPRIFAERFDGVLARYARRTDMAQELLVTFALQAGGEDGGGRQGAPDAIQVADRFHLSANAGRHWMRYYAADDDTSNMRWSPSRPRIRRRNSSATSPTAGASGNRLATPKPYGCTTSWTTAGQRHSARGLRRRRQSGLGERRHRSRDSGLRRRQHPRVVGAMAATVACGRPSSSDWRTRPAYASACPTFLRVPANGT